MPPSALPRVRVPILAPPRAAASTSVYWIPIYGLLESRGIEVVLVNARQLHYVPGRKTDVSDYQWLQPLHSRGLLRGSVRPTEAIVRLRVLQRQVANLIAERTRCVRWMQKSLDQMNVQVDRYSFGRQAVFGTPA